MLLSQPLALLARPLSTQRARRLGPDILVPLFTPPPLCSPRTSLVRLPLLYVYSTDGLLQSLSIAVSTVVRDDVVYRERILEKGWSVPCRRLRGRRSARSPVFLAKPSRRRGIGKDAVSRARRAKRSEACRGPCAAR
jgi:hypothetical protein